MPPPRHPEGRTALRNQNKHTMKTETLTFKKPVVGEVRGPFASSWGGKATGGITYAVYGPGGWVPFNEAERNASFTERQARRYAADILPLSWIEVTEEEYDEMLNILPPAYMGRGGFLVGEPMDHRGENGSPRFSAFLARDGKHLKASRPMTIAEFFKI